MPSAYINGWQPS